MSATPKSLRQPPPRRFENYILTRATSPNVTLSLIPDSLFLPAGPGATGGSPGGSSNNDGVSVSLPIGFDFSLDNITYKNFVVCANGWMVLVDPTIASLNTNDVLLSQVWINSGIRPTFTHNHVLLAPWFDDLRTVASTVGDVVINGTSMTAAAKQRVREGFQPPPIGLNQAQFGVKYYLDSRSTQGRRLIVRWNALSEAFTANAVIRFEVIIYENGKIEFRYDPRRKLSLVTTSDESATIGVFMPGAASRFRDFSLGLGYRDNERQQYRYGGAVLTASYSDISDSLTASYSVNLKTAQHWPGLDVAGSAFIFLPPTPRRRVLVRPTQVRLDSRNVLPSVARTGDYRMGTAASTYDDRRAASFTATTSSTGVIVGSVVNYPTTLQRFFGDSEPSISQRQDLFAGDFELTASVVKSAIDQFIIDETPTYIEPWSENHLYENDPGARADDFFVSGSSTSLFGTDLQQPLWSKTKVRLSLPVDNSIQLSSASCNIYYYNQRSNGWNVPQNSSYILDVTASIQQPPVSGKGDQVPAHSNPDSPNHRIIEDIRGFGPIGNLVASGNHDKSSVTDQTDASIGASFSSNAISVAVSKRYDKSIQISNDYLPTADETFQLPITQPFLIEKAVIEIPFAMGDGWFTDRTTCFQPLELLTGSFDFAGPGLTISLFNQTSFGNRSRRDLILTGTVTHNNDVTADVILSNFPAIDTVYQMRPVGFKAFGAEPGAIVTPTASGSSGLTFTGSIQTRCVAQVSNGVIVKVTQGMNRGTDQQNRNDLISLINSPRISLRGNNAQIAYINNFGRAATGFDPSGHSIFGKEYVTSNVLSNVGSVNNPLYLSGANGGLTTGNMETLLPAIGRTQFLNAINSGSKFAAVMAIPIEGCSASPYLVNPGDTLVLAVSKTRPFKYSSLAGYPYTSGSLVHDVQLITGTIEVTLYGSLIREGHEYHDTLNQYLGSDAVHELVIGNSPVLDQYEIGYRESYVSGSSDDVMTGSMVTTMVLPNGQLSITTGIRSKAFGKFDARDFGNPDDSSMSFNQQPWYERAGSPRVTGHDDITERYWDSMMPSISDCFSADNTGIWVNVSTAFTQYIADPTMVDRDNVGFMFFDNSVSIPGDRTTNNNWTWAYPFEPRYSEAARQLDVSKQFIATLAKSTPSAVGDVIIPRQLRSFYCGPRLHFIKDPGGANEEYMLFCDINLSPNTIGPKTGSMPVSDISKVLFGFGDKNTIKYVNNTRVGTNHFADWRNVDWYMTNLSAGVVMYYAQSPIIRGWKYGVISGLPTFSRSYFRPGRYGMMRDMLEQRPYTKYYQSAEKDPSNSNFRQGVTTAAVTVKFVDATGKLTKPENTWSQNLSFEATSSMPFFDGEARNRPEINTNTLNANIITFQSNQFGQITL